MNGPWSAERPWAGWLPEESLETQFSARNNGGFGSDGYLLFNGERCRRECKQERECSDSQQLPLNYRPASDLFCDANVLGLGEESQRFLAAFAADAALFHPAKGDSQVAQK